MKVIAQIKLNPTPQQHAALKQTLQQANAACNDISQTAWDTRTFKKFDLQKLVYQDVRQRFDLSAQMTVRVIAKVGDAYKRDKKTMRTFKPHGSIAYDDRILSYHLAKSTVNIWTLAGRQRLQRRGTKSTKRHLKKLRKRQARFQKDTNHRISKDLVARAKGTARGIALEDLSDIRERTRLRKAQRARHSNWGFAQLRQFISYKAALAGVLVYIINPAYTSQRCSACGHTERGNRPTQSHFCCLSCGHTTSADTNAAIHISRAAVIPPIVSETALPSRQGQAAALESVRYMTLRKVYNECGGSAREPKMISLMYGWA